VLKRNPNYKAECPANVHKVRNTRSIDHTTTALQIQKGSSVTLVTGFRPIRTASLGGGLREDSDAAREGKQQFSVDAPTILPSNNVNVSYFNDPEFNSKMDAAQAKTGEERNEPYEALDEDMARNAAPLVAWSVINTFDFFSAQVRCHLWHPVYTMDLAARCIRK
jgi:hypothetical protein